MSRSGSQEIGERRAQRARRSFTIMAAFLIGVPATAAALACVYLGPLRDTLLYRYLSHPVEVVELLLFFSALGALLAKASVAMAERTALRRQVLPPWDGQPIPAENAGPLLDGVAQIDRRWQNTWLVRRVAGVLDFVRSRGSANGLDDHVRGLADADALALEGSYGLIRFITWAIPILGFLGTVLGITEAVAGVTPEQLEKSLSTVTDGLALAFDTTALALALTMVVMFVSFLTERYEEGVLQGVDAYVDEYLLHRFQRSGPESGDFVEALRGSTQVLLQATEQLVCRQAEVWGRTVAEAQQQWHETGQKQQEVVLGALEAALGRTLEVHAGRLLALEKHQVAQGAGLLDRLGTLAEAVRQSAREQQASLAELARLLTAQTEALTRLDAGSSELLRLQASLDRNLGAVASLAAFDEAVNSLTAAVHLLSARAGASAGGQLRVVRRPGNAA